MRSKEFEIIDATFCALADREEKRGSQSISDIERVVLLVWHASGIIGNGGFLYFFECGLPLSATASAYSRIGVEQAVSIFQRVHGLFPAKQIPDDYDERMAIVEAFYKDYADLLDQLEGDFYLTDDLMRQQLAGWIRVHKDVFTGTHAS
jgi:Domain of unknown function (DUF4375)